MNDSKLRENLEEANVAEYGIVMKIDGIEGNCQLKDYEKGILVDNVQFGSSAIRTRVGTGKDKVRTSVTQSSVTALIAGGRWTAELLNALYTTRHFPEIKLVQLAQAVDKTTAAKPSAIQELKLTGAVITGVSQSWDGMDGGGGPRMISLTIEFEKILLQIDTKSADFTLLNITAGAV